MMTLQPDWEAIKAEYEGGTPLRALAAKYGVSKSAIAKHKYQEHWAEKKSGQVDKISDTGGRTRDINAATRVHMAIRIYLEEHPTWDEIARRTGFASRGACHSAVMREMERIVADDVQELRTFELHRLEKIEARCYKAAVDEVNEGWTWAVDRFLATSKRKAELMGMDAQKEDYTGPQVIIEEVPMQYFTGPVVSSGEPS